MQRSGNAHSTASIAEIDGNSQVSIPLVATKCLTPQYNTSQSHPEIERRRRFCLWVRGLIRKAKAGWRLENAGLTFSSISFVALLILLFKENGKPLDNWTFFFSLNTVASILSTGMKAPLAFVVGSCLGQWKWIWFKKRPGPIACFLDFDEASRGPSGCIPLLYRLKSLFVSACTKN
jgi:hypothetical protein